MLNMAHGRDWSQASSTAWSAGGGTATSRAALMGGRQQQQQFREEEEVDVEAELDSMHDRVQRLKRARAGCSVLFRAPFCLPEP